MARFDELAGLAESTSADVLAEAGGLKSGLKRLTHKVYATGGEFGREKQLMAAFYSAGDAYTFAKGKKTSTFVRDGGKYVIEEIGHDEASRFDQLAGLSEDRDVAASQREIGKAHKDFMAAAKKALNHVAWSEDYASDFRDQVRSADRAIKKTVMILAQQH